MSGAEVLLAFFVRGPFGTLKDFACFQLKALAPSFAKFESHFFDLFGFVAQSVKLGHAQASWDHSQMHDRFSAVACEDLYRMDKGCSSICNAT
jgi:hypothetical protein